MGMKERIAARPDTKVAAFKALTYRVHPEPDNEQIYGVFDPEHIQDDAALVDSIRTVGLIQPITVRPHPGLAEEYIIISGHRRLAAHIYLKITHIPVTVIQPETEEELLNLRAGLVQTNTMTRTRTQEIMAREVEYLKPVMKRLKEIDPQKYDGISVRTMIAEKMAVSESTVKRIQKIQNNVEPAAYQEYVEGTITQKEATEKANRAVAQRDDAILFADLGAEDKQKVEDAITDAMISNDRLSSMTEAMVKELVQESMKKHHGGARDNIIYDFAPNDGVHIKMKTIASEVRIRPAETTQAIMAGIQRRRQIVLPEVTITPEPEPEPTPAPVRKEVDQVVFNRVLKMLETAINTLGEYPELCNDPAFQMSASSVERISRQHQRTVKEAK
jgi:uncharacterized protein YbaA (DUF1428 family)